MILPPRRNVNHLIQDYELWACAFEIIHVECLDVVKNCMLSFHADDISENLSMCWLM